MARPALQKTAAASARAQYQPQIQQVRRETHGQIKSLKSLSPALEAGLQLSAQQLRHAGLNPSDLSMAEAELAHRTADVASSTYLQEQQARQAAHSQIVNLLQSEGQTQHSDLLTLLHEAATHHQKVQDEINAEGRGLHTAIAKEELERKLGIGPNANTGALSPTQQRAHSQSQHNAAFWAHQYISLARNGLKDEKTGKEILPPGPGKWNDSQWQLFVQKVSSKKGVNSITDAEHAVGAIRDHFQPAGPYAGQYVLPGVQGWGGAVHPSVAP